MKKYTKQFIVVLCVAAVLLALSAVLRTATGSSGLARTLKKSWGIELPGGYVVEYRAASDEKMEEGGLRFHVLLYDNSAALDAMVPWVPCSQSTGKAESGAQAAAEMLTALGIPGGEWPDLEQAGMWYADDGEGAEVLLLHTEEDFRLYILESFS